MSRLLIVALMASRIASAQPSCAREPVRSQLIGAAIGMVAIVLPAAAQDRNHHLDHNEWIAYAWGATWGVALGSTMGTLAANRRCGDVIRARRSQPDRDCPRSAVKGGLAGTAIGGVTGFLIAPIAAIPFSILRPQGTFERTIGVITATGAATGLVVGSLVGYPRC